jgi:hypothetical protein
MTKNQKKHIRTIVVKEETYQRLQQYKLKLIHNRKDPKITFDQVINTLLDECGGFEK